MIIICIYIGLIIIYGLIRKVECYKSFEIGVKSSYEILKQIFPNILALVFAVEVFINCGFIELIKPMFAIFKIPVELFIQALLRPLSSQSALVMMIKIFDKFGVDSFYGITSSILQGCSDTTFYVIVVYFSSVDIKNSKYALKVGLLTDILTFIAVFILCYFLLSH